MLPLFGGIYKRGAGIGPAVAFLYSGPAINVLAIVYTARILGYDLGLARAIGAIIFAAGIGLIMALIYHKEESAKSSAAFDALTVDPDAKKWWQQIVFFAILVGILEDGIKVFLGRGDHLDYISYLPSLLAAYREKQKGVKYIDIRFDGQIIVGEN